MLRKHLELTMKHGSRLVADFKLFLMCQLPIIWIEEVLILVTSGLRWPIYSIYALIKALFDEKNIYLSKCWLHYFSTACGV